jgi:hypothetical protein
MQCRDAQFYLRLRRHAGDELGAEVSGDLDRHVAGCPACAADARSAASFDRAVARAMTAVPVPAGLHDKLMTLASAHRGGVIRRKAYQVAALAASIFLVAGLSFGIFTATRPRIDGNTIVTSTDRLVQDPDGALRDWLIAQKLPDQLPEPFDPDLLFHLGKETVQGKDVPVVLFRHRTDPRGFARVYIFRDDGTYNLKDLQDAQASHSMARVINDPVRFRGVKYVIVHTVHPDPVDRNLLKPFLRQSRDTAGRS